MSEVKHTPGPWSLVLGDEEFWSVMGTARPELDGCYLVAEVINGNGRPQNEANARLIAAAPDMLAALQRISFLLSATGEDPGEPSFMPEVRAAISKATGSQE